MRSLSLSLSLLLLSCHSAEPPAPAPASQKAEARKVEPSGPRKFGASLGSSPAIPLRAVLEKPDEFSARTVTVEARVRRNCTRRGCWMEIAEASDPSLPGCRVTFKDYGFFVPLDSAGSSARVEGTVQVQSVAPAEVVHMESEGARFAAKQPDGSAREVRMVATGVELWRE